MKIDDLDIIIYDHHEINDDFTDEELDYYESEKLEVLVEESDDEAFSLWEEDFYIDDNNEVFFQEKEITRRPEKKIGRTTVRQNCNINAHFGLSLNKQNGKSTGKILFAKAQPELKLTSNGSVGVRIKLVSVGNFEGTLSIVVTREAGANPPARQYTATDITSLNNQISNDSEIPIPAPAGMNARTKRVVVETLEAIITWTPNGHKPCSLTETLNIRWEYRNPRSRFKWWPPSTKTKGRNKVRTSHGSSLKPYTNPDGQTYFSVPIQTFFPLKDPNKCCGKAGETAIIQFVRHEWNLKENPVKTGSDKWSLDTLESELDKANANPPQVYDPTFTHNPEGSSGHPDIVYPGPDPDGNLALNQYDRPGVSRALYNRFRNANPGSKFIYHFLSLMVCKKSPSTGTTYLNDAKVHGLFEYKLIIKFNGPRQEPDIDIKLLSYDVASPCKSFSDIIDIYDRNRRRTRQFGSLRSAYTSPRGHSVAIPSQ